MFVLGWDSVVVEGWSACFLVGIVVVFFGKIVDFGELILAKIALPGDIQRIVRQLLFGVKVPLEHFSLAFPRAASMRIGDAFELGALIPPSRLFVVETQCLGSSAFGGGCR